MAKEKFSRILEHDVPAPLIANLDQAPLSYVSQGKYTFSFKGAKMYRSKGLMIKDRSLQLLLFLSLEHFCPFNWFTRGKPSAPCQSLDFQPRSHLVTQKITGRTQKNQLSFSSKLSFHISRWLKEKMDTQKDSTLL